MKLLTKERAWRTYLGGLLLDEIEHQENPKDSHFPEIWMFSTTKALNSGREDIIEGLSYLKDQNITFKDWIENNPQVLGKKHLEKYDSTLGVLIKLIDSAERLTIQVHPDDNKALKLFNSPFGKTECWYILGCRDDDACIYLGFKEGVTKEKFIDLFNKEDNDGMLNCLNKIKIKPGETYLVTGGTPHAIGKGCLIVEVQQPTDYTIRVERTTPSGFRIDDKQCHQGLGFDRMFDCFHFENSTLASILNKYQMKPKTAQVDNNTISQIVTYKNTPCFTITKIDVKDSFALDSSNSYQCLFIIEGSGVIKNTHEEIKVVPYDQVFISANEQISISGNIKALVFTGPKD